MAFSIIPNGKYRKKKQWKEVNLTVDKEYSIYINMGNGVFFNDVSEPIFIGRDKLRRMKRNRDFFFKVVRRRLQ